MSSGVPESKLTYAEIEDAAEAFAQEYSFDPQQHDIRGLVEKLGGRLGLAETCDPMTQNGGAMSAWRGGDFIIYLPPFTGILRDNFTIAHEIGHLQLHVPEYFKQHPDSDRVRVNRFGNDKPELQANRFAAALLMPAEIFTSIGVETGWDIPALSIQFSVSQPAAQFRADFLKR
ncbi:MAG: ImmA/IrrE family metallo-endopeptidase [Magnetococcus sp. DMHC-1]|nr:ImmA/IrrE family metallo-endopeptidase [Magnetococcales bacterium]